MAGPSTAASSTGRRASEVVAHHGGGDGGIKRLGPALPGNSNVIRYKLPDGEGQTPALAADDQHRIAQGWQAVDVFSGEITTDHGRGTAGQRAGERGGVHPHARKRPHAGVDDLLGKQVGAAGREQHTVDRKPVGDPQEGADVARVLDGVEREGEAAVERTGRRVARARCARPPAPAKGWGNG